MSGWGRGRSFERGEDGYEEARRAAVWNRRTPPRHPDVIVEARDDDDVVAAVRQAHERGLRIGVRSGGHSWVGSHLRDGGMLLDVSRLDGLEVDAASRTAIAGPGCRGVTAALAEQGLFFPSGHDRGVALGGYLLQGGFGWNGRVHGPACQSVEAIDVVTAAGEVVRADADHHPELLWAARGSGPGFFGVVLRFHLRLQPSPQHMAISVLRYPAEVMDDIFGWAQEVGPRVPRTVELMVFLQRGAHGEPELAVTAPALVDSREEAADALSFLATCPMRERATLVVPDTRVELADLYAAVHEFYPDEHRYAVDNMWTHATAAELLPGLRKIAATLPAAPSSMMWMNWGPVPERPAMAYSVEDQTYIALYGAWRDAAHDAVNVAWPEDRMREMEHLATGIQLADENLGRRPARFVSEPNMSRLDGIRERYDPHGLFHAWMARP